jgi:cytochrome bd-type quinol oxidase subunit 2
MSSRGVVRLVWCMWAASLTLTVLGLLFLITSRSRTGAPVYDYWLVNTMIAIGFSTVGATITPRLPPRIL